MRGFTLIEIIVVVAIFSVLLTLGLFMSMETLHGAIYRSERETMVSLLQMARSRAMNNIEQTPWGVYYDQPAHSYILFRGPAFDAASSTNEITEGSAAVRLSGLYAPGVVFSQLSGTTTATTTVIVEDSRTSTTSINNEGTILW